MPVKRTGNRAGFDFGLILENRGDGFEHTADLVGCSIAPQVERDMEEHFVAAVEILEGHGGERSVGDGDKGPVESADARGAQPDIFDGAHIATELAEIAHRNGAIADDRDAAEQIFDGLLRSRGAIATPPMPRPSQERGGVVAPGSENRRDDKEQHDDLGEPSGERQDGVREGAMPGFEPGAQTQGDHVDDDCAQPEYAAEEKKSENAAEVEAQECGGAEPHHTGAEQCHG